MKEDQQPDPVLLYGRYKKNRTQAVSGKAARADLADFTPGEDLAEQVYKRYQQTRTVDVTAVDDIMQVIAASASGAHKVEDQPSPSAYNGPDIHTIDNSQTADGSMRRFDWFRKLSGNDSHGAGKFILPAVAAAVFAFVLLPFINTKDNTSDPATVLADSSADLVRFIKPDAGSMLGFTNPDSERGSVFRYGVLATDLQILKGGDGSARQTKTLVQSYLQDGSVNPDQINIAAEGVVAKFAKNSSSDSITAEMVNSIDALLGATQEYADNSGHLNWYNLGQSVEFVALASQHALSTSDTAVLQSAIKRGRAVDVPEEDANLTNLVDDLFSEQIHDSMPAADLRRIINKAEDIKTVVQ